MAERGSSTLRSAGFNNIDVKAAEDLGLTVVRVPEYSPNAVAEYSVGLMLCLNRKIYRAYSRVRDGNFSLEGLIGFDMKGKTVGIAGTGKIGSDVARILKGFDCRLLGYDLYENEECRRLGLEYVSLDELFRRSDIITLHCPLTPQTHHMINRDSILIMKDNVMIINTGRGALINTVDVIDFLKSGKIGLWPGRLRGRIRHIFRKPFRQGFKRRRTCEAPDFSKCPDYVSPGIFHAGGNAEHSIHHAFKYF